MPFHRPLPVWRRVAHAVSRYAGSVAYLADDFGRALLRLAARSLGWVARWWVRRDGWQLVRGLPALAVLVGAAVFGVICWRTAPAALVGPYRNAATHAMAGKDYQTARTCYDRLTVLEENNPKNRWGLALAADALGERDECDALLQDLAPPGQIGYGPAHLLAAEHLLRRPKPTEEDQREAERHLLWAVKALPESDEPPLALARYYLGRGKTNLAEPYLAQVVWKHPELHLSLAWVYVGRGDKEKARRHATEAVRYYRGQVEDDPEKQALRFFWAEALGLLGDHAEAVAVLKRGLEQTGAPPFRKALAQAYAALAEAMGRDRKAPVAGRLNLLGVALTYDSENVPALTQLLALSRGAGDDGAKGRAALEAALARGQSSPVVHLVLGLDAWKNAQNDKALLHMEQAYKLSPKGSPIVANNLAWLLATGPEPDLERALVLVESALKSQPNNLAIRDTRGRILARMGRWKEALVDLELALPALPDDRELHGVLADVYEHLGNPSLAAEHRRLAEAKKP
ncbi:MAG TPA: tetratricopeptide repeat protein [Gemmataceae bacterium]|nr:tetratricopeptide repeat protein [Gemmataceae bacterium]